MKHIVGPVAQWFSETLGHMAAAYRLYLAKANAQAAAEARYAKLAAFQQGSAETIAWIASEAIWATRELTHLVVERREEVESTATCGMGSVPYVQFCLWQRPGHSDSVPADRIRKYIQTELNTRCKRIGIAGSGKIIVDVRIPAVNRVVLRFGFQENTNGYRR